LSEVFLLDRRLWLLPMVVWASIVSWSLYSNIRSITDHNMELAHATAQNIFRIVQLTRYWNARHGGVYVPISPYAEPNPYLDVPNRDIETRDNLKLTMINPAYMTRQLTELIEKDSEVSFHITSLKPLRPQNRADPWERLALQKFENGLASYSERVVDADGDLFRYMAPLFVREPCLKCHEQQGYQLGDIRGGISVTLDSSYIFARQSGVIAYEVGKHAAVFVLVGAMLLLFLERVRAHWQQMIAVKLEQEAIIEARTRELRELAVHDPLTGLFNRKALDDYFSQEIQRAQRYDHPVAVFMLDIDHFKRINDCYSHRAGDQLLQMLSQVMQKNIRNTDFAARYGGEEFVIVLPETPLHEATRLAERMRRDIEAMVVEVEPSAKLSISASIGIAVFPVHAHNAEELVHKADAAMYMAKRAGRNQVVIAQ
jgi:diguanylate cyclase (GGDEF)-like protein